MSCLAPAPLSDLATKADIAKLESRFDQLLLLREADSKEQATQRDADSKEQATQRDADSKEQATQRDADRKGQATQRESDRKEHAALREADRKEFRRSLRRIEFALPVEMVVALAAVIAVSEWLRS